MQLAAHAGEGTGGWILGFVIGLAVVVVVVIVALTLIILADRIRKQALAGTESLDAARKNTLPLWDVQDTNRTAKAILEAARTARGALGG